MIHLITILYVALGGAIGAVLRFSTGLAIAQIATKPFPYGTMSVNLLGAFIIGILWSVFEHIPISDNLRLMLFTGVLGGFTTFSSFALESINLMKNGNMKLAIIYITITNVMGLILAFSGMSIAKKYFI